MTSTPRADCRNWDDAPLADLVAHVRSACHRPLAAELEQLTALADRVAARHGDALPMLDVLRETVGGLRAILERHLYREDRQVFSVILHLVTVPDSDTGDRQALAATIAEMTAEHDRVMDLLARMRALTSGYEPPDWACPTFRTLYDRLSLVEHGLRLHLRLENDVLFPRALSLIDRRRT